jgi:hypothetical protein
VRLSAWVTGVWGSCTTLLPGIGWGGLGVGCCGSDISEGEGRPEGGVGGISGCGPIMSVGDDRWVCGVGGCSEWWRGCRGVGGMTGLGRQSQGMNEGGNRVKHLRGTMV